MKQIIGIALGGLAGFLYYRWVGCSTGACPITSNPFMSIIYGGFVGFVATMSGS